MQGISVYIEEVNQALRRHLIGMSYETDPELRNDIESQLLSNASDDDMQLLSVELDAQGNPPVVVHPSQDITQVIDDETLA